MYRDAIKSAQRVLRDHAGYRGPLSGKVTRGTLAAAWRVAGVDTVDGGLWQADRRVIGAAQVILRQRGFKPGAIDGRWGPATDAAFLAWRGDALPARTAAPGLLALEPAGGVQCTAGRIVPPWRMILAWDTAQVVTHIACHKDVAASGQRAFDRIAALYTEVERRELGLHLYGGCYNYRAMRGGAALSTHAYGAAIDFDPGRNRLTWGADRARLAQPDAVPFWEAWEAEGWVSLGRARNFDWMHVQAVPV